MAGLGAYMQLLLYRRAVIGVIYLARVNQYTSEGRLVMPSVPEGTALIPALPHPRPPPQLCPAGLRTFCSPHQVPPSTPPAATAESTVILAELPPLSPHLHPHQTPLGSHFLPACPQSRKDSS